MLAKVQKKYNPCCPVIYVTGEYDVAPGLETMKAQARMVKNGRLIIAPDIGHYVPIERPTAMNSIFHIVTNTVA